VTAINLQILADTLLAIAIATFAAAIALVIFGAWILWRGEPEEEEHAPPRWHPEHSDMHADDWAQRRFEDMRINADAKRAAHQRRHP
jgi:ABC-type nickel/cobalt efflux system permease component RcnA